ncbi:hypothetical protein STEG23_014119 [Scotinomys teguina]
MFSEKVRFCYNTAPEGKPTGFIWCSIDSTAILSSAGENLAASDLVRHDVSHVGLQCRAFLQLVLRCVGWPSTRHLTNKIECDRQGVALGVLPGEQGREASSCFEEDSTFPLALESLEELTFSWLALSFKFPPSSALQMSS